MLLQCDCIFLLNGWETSNGAKLEASIANALDYEFRYEPGALQLEAGVIPPWLWNDAVPNLPESKPQPTLSICQEADIIVSADRQSDYGHPRHNFGKTAKLWEAVFNTPVSAHQVGLCMILLKVARESYFPKRDNLVDIAGYAKTLDLLNE